MSQAPEQLRRALSDRYRIERELGQGGMATVYLAEDLKHKRRVAVKVLKPELAAVLGAERFVQEITTTAALQHPHILPLFDSGEADGFLYYVMPFIDGETLRAKLDRETQLGVDDAVKIASDVADALHYAHEQGVVHRDIKPENILLANGRPMVADFGIALAVSAAAGGRMTETGLSLGTPHYMSPEQATAEKEITRRSDVYSLASVLYEMLAGQPPHLGGSAQQIIMKIIAEPSEPVTRYRKSVPPNVAAALAKALEKLPADRFATADTFANALADPTFAGSKSGAAYKASSSAGMAGAGPSRRALTAAIGVAAVSLGAAAWALSRPAPPRPVSRYQVGLPEGQAIAGSYARVAVAPDGARLIFSGVGAGGQRGLWLRERDQLETTLLSGTSDAIAPFFSPDGSRVGFLTRGVLKIQSLRGGPSFTLSDPLVGTAGGTWSADGFIYTDGLDLAPLARVTLEGKGKSEWFTRLDSASGEVDHFFPHALPNGRGVLFTVVYNGQQRNIAVAETRTGEHRVLLAGEYARYARSGHLLYATADGALMAVRFDADAMVLTGDPVVVATGVSLRSVGVPDLDISNDGTLVYTTGGPTSSGGEPVWVSRDGRTERIAPDWSPTASTLALSPDGTQLALGINDGRETHVWVRHLERGTLSRLSLTGSLNYRPSWAPDGRSVTYISTGDDGGVRQLVTRRADGSSETTVPLPVRNGNRAPVWEGFVTRDGAWVVYRIGNGSAADLYARRTSGDTTPIALATTSTSESAPAVSPDGRWLAYVAVETGRHHVYVRPFPNVDAGKWLVSPAGGTEPVWSRNGAELFYRNDRGEMISAQVVPESSPPIGEQRVLFDASGFSEDRLHQMYDVSADGRFLMTRVARAGEGNEAQLIVVENFFEELRRRVPR